MKGRVIRRFALAFLVSLATGCGRDASLTFPGSPVVLISVDTLRADHLPAYGYAGNATPHLDALRTDAVLYANAYSHVPLTLPSHLSLLTGRLPAEHGVRDNLGYRLNPGAETLGKLLKRHGYRTGGAVSTIVLTGASGMRDGFDLYDDAIEATVPNASLARVQRAGGETAESLERWIGTGSGPFFAFLHLYEPHTPYEPPEPYRSRYASNPYDGEIARADEIVGGFLAFLKERGVYDRALIIFLSDHGEGLGEHGEDEHGVTLYRETLHVPLLVKLPNQRHAGETVAAPVGLFDVFPTVAAAAAGEKPAVPGVPLTAFLTREKPPARRIFSETAFPRLHYGWSDLASLIDDRYHYIDAPRPELYDLAADAREERDLSAGLPPAFRSMRIEMATARSARIESPAAVDPEQAARLASLGYIGSTAADAGAKELPDPKDKIAVVRAMKKGFGLLQAGRPEDAAAAFREVLKTEPKMVDVWNGLAQAEKRSGHGDAAIAALKEVVRLSPPGATENLLAVAGLALELGKLDEARENAEAALAGGNDFAHETLASVALARKDFDTAEREAAEATRLHPKRRLPRLIQARILIKRVRLPEALALLDAILAETGAEKREPLIGVRAARADALARMGKESEAEAEFGEELRLFPQNTEAYENLAFLYASQGRDDRVYETLRRLMKELPGRPSTLAAARVLEMLGDRRGAEALRRGAAS